MLPKPTLPDDLPVPVDDGACDHLEGAFLPAVTLRSSSGRAIMLNELRGITVIYVYPRSGSDDSVLPDNWDAIPGARGCSPQSCSFRDHQKDLAEFGAQVFGLSTQSKSYLAGEVERLHLPFELLSDESLALAKALRLPLFEFEVAQMPVLKRVTLLCRDDRIVKVFYPVFPPDKNPDEVIAYLRSGVKGPGRSNL